MKSFFEDNRKNLLNKMKNGEMAIFFSGEAPQSSADSHYTFRPDKNFFYLTGLIRETFILVLLKTENKVEETIFIEKPDFEIEKWVGRKLKIETVKEISGIESVQYLTGFDAWINKIIYSTNYDSMLLDLARMKFEGESTTAMEFATKVQKNYPFMIIKNSHKFMSELRSIKTDFEVEQIEKAINLTKNGLEAIMNSLKPDDNECVPSAEFNYSIMKNGSDGNAFSTIAASGENAVILHYVENDQKMEDGNLILMDLGAQYKQYASDITRTYPINGRFTDRQKVLYNIVLKANIEVAKMMKPGVNFSELNKRSTEILAEGLLEIGLIKDKSEISKYYYHGVSHYMGLDVHDLGFRDVVLAPGMIFTVEPGLYISEEKIGIRIEDDILITEDGHRNLSEKIIKTVEDIEKFMNK